MENHILISLIPLIMLISIDKGVKCKIIVSILYLPLAIYYFKFLEFDIEVYSIATFILFIISLSTVGIRQSGKSKKEIVLLISALYLVALILLIIINPALRFLIICILLSVVLQYIFNSVYFSKSATPIFMLIPLVLNLIVNYKDIYAILNIGFVLILWLLSYKKFDVKRLIDLSMIILLVTIVVTRQLHFALFSIAFSLFLLSIIIFEKRRFVISNNILKILLAIVSLIMVIGSVYYIYVDVSNIILVFYGYCVGIYLYKVLTKEVKI